MIENRHPEPAHIRDLLLLAATSCSATDDLVLLERLDVIDVIGVGAVLVAGQLAALTAPVRDVEARHALAVDVFELAAAVGLAERSAIGAMSCVVGAVGAGERHAAAAIATALESFDERELLGAAVALVAATVARLARGAGVSPAAVVGWSADDSPAAASTRRTARATFCARSRAAAAARDARR